MKLLAQSPPEPQSWVQPHQVMLLVHLPLSRLELTKSICLCESAEKYSAFIRVKGHGIGQCQSTEIFPQLATCTSHRERGLHFQFLFTRGAVLHQQRMWPVVCTAMAAEQGSFHQQTNVQTASPSTHCDVVAAGTLGKSEDDSIFFSSKAK